MDEARFITVNDHRVATYSYGSGTEVLLCISGGPGMPCDYLRESHARLAHEGFRVVTYDPLGTGASEKPDTPSLLTLRYYIAEVEAVRTGLGLGCVHLLGQSWGVWLAIEHCLRHSATVASLILANGSGDVPLHLAGMQRLRQALGPSVVAMMEAHEAAGATDDSSYKAILGILDRRHICRLPDWPESLKQSIAGTNMSIYRSLWGPNDYVCTGPMRTWDRLPDLPRIIQPTLVIGGVHDEFTPADAGRLHDGLPQAQRLLLPESSHTPFFEQPEEYFAAVTGFLKTHLAEAAPERSERVINASAG